MKASLPPQVSVLILAAAMTLSLAGCSDAEAGSSGAEDIPAAVRMDHSGSDIRRDSEDVPDSPEILAPPTAGDDSEKGSGSEDILTPPTTESQYLAGPGFDDCVFTAEVQAYSSENEVKFYECKITGAAKQEVSEMLSAILKSRELTLGEDQSIIDVITPVLTLKKPDGSEYTVCEALLSDNPLLESERSVYVFTAPHSQLYFEADNDDLSELLDSLARTEENLIETKKLSSEFEPGAVVKPEFPLTYIEIRTNFAWGHYITGNFIDAKGYLFSFDLSEALETGPGYKDFTSTVYENLQRGIGIDPQPAAVTDVSVLEEGLGYAAGNGSDATFREEEKMMDYGQHTLYAVVGGELVMLYSRGDVDRTSDDANVKNALRCYKDALNNAESLTKIIG